MSTSEQNVKFRHSVRVALAAKEWTQDRLAKRVRRSRQAVNRAIRHGEFPGVRKLIATALDIEIPN